MRFLIPLLIAILIFSCKKNVTTPNVDIDSELRNTWTLVSETRTGAFNERYLPPPGISKIRFDNNGNAYPNFEGQFDLVYPYNLKVDTKTINYKFIFFLPPYTANIQTANIQVISSNLLVLQNTFYSGNYSITLIDSLVK